MSVKYELVNTMKDPYVDRFFLEMGKKDGAVIEIKTEKAFDKLMRTILDNGCVYFVRTKNKTTYQIRVIRNVPVME